ncbi:hypothetical protein [Candidatus Tisiphia endosymbiont of Beris chalybata]|uniref:hypothetical protein n=1 Tax=Candidatus Tisiphia endosymbiont of Beris chalybata TaxID=3066262 RepID=UPI00312C70F6
MTLPEEIKEFEVNIQNNFPKIRTINTEIPPEAQELKAQLAALLNSNNSPKLPASARNVSNNKSLPLKLEKANNKGIGRQL